MRPVVDEPGTPVPVEYDDTTRIPLAEMREYDAMMHRWEADRTAAAVSWLRARGWKVVKA